MGWGRQPKSLFQYLPKIEVRSAVLPNFGFRQLPPAAVGFRGLPSPHILLEARRHGIWEGVGSQSSRANIYLELKFSVLLTPNFRFRQHPPASATYTIGRVQTYATTRSTGGLLPLSPMRAWRIFNNSPCGFPSIHTSIDVLAIF